MIKFSNQIRRGMLLLCAVSLAGCGGGGGGGVAAGDSTVPLACAGGTAAGAESIVYRRTVAGTGQVDAYIVRENCTGAAVLVATGENEFPQGVDPSSGRIIILRDANGQTDLVSVRADGTDTRIIANSSDAEYFHGVTTSGRVVYVRDVGGNWDIYSANADGTDVKQLTSDPLSEEPKAVSASGDVVFSRYDPDTTVTGFYSVPADGSGAAIHLYDGGDFVALAPGNRVIYLQYTIQGRNLYSMKLDGTAPVSLATTSGDDHFAFVGPSGEVYYEHDAGSVKYDVYRVNADGSGTTQLSSSADDERFGFVASDGRVVYFRWEGGNYNIYSVGADGTGLVTLAATADHETPAAVTPSGRLIYSRITGGTAYLYSVGADGTGTQQLSAHPGSSFEALTAAEVVVFRYGGGYSLATVNADGTNEKTLASAAAHFKLLTANGRIIYQVAGTGGSTDLHSVNPDGSGDMSLAATGDGEEFALAFP